LATLAAPGVSATARSREDVTDHDLVQAVRAGDDHAFERLYHRYHRRIAAYIFGMVRDHGRAEDLTQEVFVSALRRMRQTDRPIAFKPWVYEIAKNACIDAFRRSRRAEEVSYDADEGMAPSDYGRLVATTAAPDAAVAAKQQLDDLCGAFGGLSEAHHQILVMRELEGLSYREIGERLGMSRPSVESTLFRARRRLTEEYGELVSGERCLRIQQIIATAAGTARPALGTRDQRRVGTHISYCQPCRKHARLAGLDAAVMARRPVRAKIAALLPLPGFLRRRWLPDHHSDGVTTAAAQHAPSLAQLSVAAAQYSEPTMAGWIKATAVATAVAVTGVGAGTAVHHARATKHHDPPIVRSSSSAAARGATAAAAHRSARAATTTVSRSSSGSASTGTSSPARGGSATSSSGSTTGRAGGSSAGADRTPAATPSSAGGSGPASNATASGPTKTGAAPAPVKSSLDKVTSVLTGGGSSGGDSGGGSSPIVAPDPAPVLQQSTAATPPSTPGGVVQQVTQTAGQTVGGSAGQTVQNTGQQVGGAVDQATDAVKGTVGGILGGK